jgi:hypothetical protein
MTALADGADRDRTAGSSLTSQPPNAIFSGGEFAGSQFESLLGIYDTLLDRFMPPLILIDAERRVIDTFAGADRFRRRCMVHRSLPRMGDALRTARDQRRPVGDARRPVA